MNAELLRTFLELAKTGHFGRTAERLHLTQSAVSLRIKQLEALVGTPLFTRDKHNVVISVAGERLRQHAELILSSWQMALQDINAIQDDHKLKVGCTPNIWSAFLQAEWFRWQELLPTLDLCIQLDTAQGIEQSLQNGQLDLILSPVLFINASMPSFKYRDIELQLLSRKTASQFSELDLRDYVFVDWHSICNMQQHYLFQSTSARFYTDQCLLAFDFLLQHGGFAFLPADWLSKSRRLHRVGGIEPLNHPIYIHYRKSQNPFMSQNLDQLRTLLERKT